MKKPILLALIAILPACLTAILGYAQALKQAPAQIAKEELTTRRLRFGISQNPNFKELTYPNYGISLLVPSAWTVEDGPAVLAGGEFSVVSRYEDSKAFKVSRSFL